MSRQILLGALTTICLFTQPLQAADTAATTAPAFVAKEYVCKSSTMIRKVKVGFGDEKSGKECKVSYLKVTEAPNTEKVLWNSPNNGKYCQDHASTFVEKLKGQGWSCD